MHILKTLVVLVVVATLSNSAFGQFLRPFGFGDCISYTLGNGCGCARVASTNPGSCSSCDSCVMDGCTAMGGSGMPGDPGAMGDPGALDAGSGSMSTADIGSFGLLAGSTGVTAGSVSAAPGMIGDFFGGSYSMFIPSAGQTHGATNIGIAGADRRLKYAENNSPFPTDRLFFNYSHFHNALLTADGRNANLNRGTFGLEKTFLEGMTSLELRIPVVSGLNNTQINDSDANNVSNEFGNLSLAAKVLLLQRAGFSVSTGLGIVFPTAKDSTLSDPSGNPIFLIENEAVYLQPFIGLAFNPNGRLFVQSFFQLDFDTNGNTTTILTRSVGNSGRAQDQTLMFLDMSAGYWLYRNNQGNPLLTGFAPMIELHYTTTLNNTDLVNMGQGDVVTNPNNRVDVLNLTGGLRFELRGQSYLTIAGVAPLRVDGDKVFDAELGVQFVRTY